MANSADALRKLQSGQTLTAADREVLGLAPATSSTPTAPKTIDQMTQAEIDAFTAAQIASGASSLGVGITDKSRLIPGESFAEANARISAGYKEMLAKPIPSELQTTAGMTVQYVRTQAGGIGSYTTTVPPYFQQDRTVTDWTAGIIPVNSPYTTGTTLGVYSKGDGTYTTVSGAPVTGKTGTTGGSTGGSAGGSTGGKTGGTTGGFPNGTGGSSGGTSTPTTNIEVLKSLLKGAGYSAKLIEASATFLQQILKDVGDYDNAVEIFLNTKEYTLKNGTKVQSPFYSEYGYLNESAPRPLAASELYGLVEGVKNLTTKYNLNTKFSTAESLKKYVANGVTVEDLEARANTARLKALESDTSYVAALQKLGFIGTASDLTDFYMDPKIGQDTLEQNKRMGTFAAEAIRRASAGIEFGKQQKALAEQLAAGSQLRNTDIQAYAATGYQNIAETLKPLTALTGIYERAGLGAGKQSDIQGTIQAELEQEEFMGTASARRKRYLEQNKRAFEGQSGGYTRYGINLGLSNQLMPGIL